MALAGLALAGKATKATESAQAEGVAVELDTRAGFRLVEEEEGKMQFSSTNSGASRLAPVSHG